MTSTALWGIAFDSEIDLPGPAVDLPPDVAVRLGDAPDEAPSARAEGICYRAAPGVFRFAVPGVASFVVRGGAEIVVDSSPGADPGMTRLLLLGTPMGALLHQRERIPLHAAAVQVDGGCVVLAGHSANGKSAQAAGFHQAGYRVLADDICALHADADGTVIAEVGPSELLVWPDTLRQLHLDPDQHPAVRMGLAKRRLPVATADRALPVRGIYVLAHHNKPDLLVEPIENLGRVRVVLAHTRGEGYLEGLGAKPSHFRTSMAIARDVPIARVVRPVGEPNIAQVREAILADLAQQVGAPP